MTNDPPVRVEPTTFFLTAVKRLRKKYPRIKQDLQPLVEQLELGETPGEQVQGVGQPVYKVRLRNTDARRGKSGGYRILYYIRQADHVILLHIYSKSELSDIPRDVIRRQLDDLE